jgi:hypothetical protein
MACLTVKKFDFLAKSDALDPIFKRISDDNNKYARSR